MTTTNDVLLSDSKNEPEATLMLALVSLIAFPALVLLSGFLMSAASEGGSVLLSVFGGAILLLAIAVVFYAHQRWLWRHRNLCERAHQARLDFLSERGVEVPGDTVDELFPASLQAEDGLIAMAQGMVAGKASTLAMHQRDGELILTGTNGRVLRPLVVA